MGFKSMTGLRPCAYSVSPCRAGVLSTCVAMTILVPVHGHAMPGAPLSGGPLSGLTAASGTQGSSGNEGKHSDVRRWTITPTFSVQALYSDNIGLSESGADSDWMIALAPGLALDGRTRRLKSHLDYQIRQVSYLDNDQANDTQNVLNTFNTLELVDDRLFLDVTGKIGQQSVSAFGATPGRAFNLDGNRAETSMLQVSPYLKGRFLDRITYDLRYRHSLTRVEGDTGADFTGDQWDARIGSAIPGTRMSWSLAYDASRYEYSRQDNRKQDALTGLLTIRATPRLNVSLGLVRDSNDFENRGASENTGLALGVEWRPSARTSLTASWGERGYGSAYDLSLNHRFPLTEVRYTLARGVSALPANLTYIGYGGLFDLLYANLATSVPDQDQRAAQVTKLLADYGLDPGSTEVGDFLRNQVTLNTRHSLQWVKRGVRNVLTVNIDRNESSGLTEFDLPIDPVSGSRRVEQTGISVSLSHKLSARSNLSGAMTYRKVDGDGGRDSRETSYNVSYHTLLGQHATVSASLSRRENKGDQAFDENALMLMFGYRF